jgi:hypothetical protein
LAGADYRAELRLDHSDTALTLTGHLEIEVFVDDPVLVPLQLRGAVLATAQLDGRPAKLSVVGTANRGAAQTGFGIAPMQQRAGRAVLRDKSGLLLHISGQGRHALDFVVRARIEQRGGWRVMRAMLPIAPATSLTLSVPDPGTDIRMAGVSDRRLHETTGAGEQIRTAMKPGGELQIEWRPSVSRGLVDLSLKAASTAVLDVLEDGVRLHWNVEMEFLRGQRDSFSIELPSAYLVEKVEGTNVRGWEIRAGDAGRQTLDVSLLKVAEDRERFAVHVRRPWSSAGVDPGPLAVPVLDVVGASLHGGTLVVRRSPVLEVRTVQTTGVTRTDLPKAIGRTVGIDDSLSPLGVHPLAAYRFVATPYVIRLAVAPVEAKVGARLQTILRIAARERRLESRVLLDVQQRPIYLVRLLIPGNLELDHVSAAGSAEWSVQPHTDGRRLLTVFMQTGQRGSVPVVIRGRLGARAVADEVALPVITVLEAPDQEGDVVVQVDPAFDVSVHGLRNCESVLLNRVASWLQSQQRATARLALHHRTSDYAAVFKLSAREPDVSCDIVTNLRLTDRAIEDTVLLDFTVRRAGIRTVSFLLPGFMSEARISVPLLQRKTIEPVSRPEGWVRVRLDLQDEVMDRLRVLVESDRLLTPGGDGYRAPMPQVETGRTNRRYVALENVGRDELVVASHAGFEPLSRRQQEWQTIASILQAGLTEAYLARSDAGDPALVFKTKQRVEVETAGARIGLAKTLLVLDANGAYRAAQVYRIDNSTEQYLEIEFPEGAEQWAVRVAGEPVKPARLRDPAKPRNLRIPLVKTALGDLDYEIMIKYGGSIDALDRLSSVDFPLIRTVNINVELSQVRLFAPETHTWFDFGGSMRQVTQAGDFEAGYLSYQTKSVERLAQTMRDANLYAQLRAAQNIENLKTEIKGFQRSIDAYGNNEELRKQRASQSLALESAEGELQRIDQTPALAGVADNRRRLQEFWKDQHYARSKNVVQDLPGNFRTEVTDGEGMVATGERFSDRWIVANELNNEPDVVLDNGRVTRAAGPARNRGSDVGDDQPKAPEVAQRDVIAKLNADIDMSELTETDSVQRLEDEAVGKAGRYKRRLADRAPRAVQPQSLFGGSDDREADSDAVQLRPMAGRGRLNAQDGIGVGGGAAPTVGLGLVSLDVALPQRGIEYRFTTPRGDIEITARAVARRTVTTLWRLGIFLAVVGAMLAVRRLVRDREAWTLESGKVGVTLVAIGLTGIVGGVLPNAAVIVIVIGIIVTIRAYLARRADLAGLGTAM